MERGGCLSCCWGWGFSQPASQCLGKPPNLQDLPLPLGGLATLLPRSDLPGLSMSGLYLAFFLVNEGRSV